MSKKFSLPLKIYLLLSLCLCMILASCNMPGETGSQTTLNVTQAYQTLQARLTFAVGQTPLATSSPTAPVSEGDSTNTPLIEFTATPTNPSTTLPTDTPNSQESQPVCDQAGAGYPKIDIEIEDDTEMAPGEAFTKVWRIANAGTCAWTTDYKVVFFSGEIMGASSSQPLEETVPTGSSIDIAVSMVAPEQTGTYQGNWKLQNADGEMFGIGPEGESPFWVRIQVVSEFSETATATPSLTPTTEIQASGAVTLTVDDTLDLDTLEINAGTTDIRYRKAVVDLRYQLFPVIGVTVSAFGGIQPTLSQCQGASLANAPIFLDELSVGDYICYRTNLGLPGWIRFDGIDSSTETVSLLILTWKLP